MTRAAGRLRKAAANVALAAGAALAGVLLACAEAGGRDPAAATAFLRREGLLVVALLAAGQAAAEAVRWRRGRASRSGRGRGG